MDLFVGNKSKELKEKDLIISSYKRQKEEYRDKWQDEQMKNAKLENKIENLEYTNKQLTDWIFKIINELGCYKVNEDIQVRIPIMENVNGFGYSDAEWHRKIETTIPKITFTKVEKYQE